jgi:hypothetical protein
MGAGGRRYAIRNKEVQIPRRWHRRCCRAPPFFLVRFQAFLGKGGPGGIQKHHRHIFTQSPCRKLFPENFGQKNRQKFRCQFFLDFFVLSRFGVSQRWEFKTTNKTFCKKIVSKSLQKNRVDQKSKIVFFSIFLDHIFGLFSVRGFQNHH